MDHDTRLVTVVGNHDLRVVAQYFGILELSDRDTATDLLEAADSDEMIRWLLSRPLLHWREARLLLHAGIGPTRSLASVKTESSRISARLQDPGRVRTLLQEYFDDSHQGSDVLLLRELTLLRACKENGEVLQGFTGPPEELPPGYRPWFAFWRERHPEIEVYFGHWARLGFYRKAGVTALDSGCVYGGQLTAVRVEDGAIFQTDC